MMAALEAHYEKKGWTLCRYKDIVDTMIDMTECILLLDPVEEEFGIDTRFAKPSLVIIMDEV